MPAKGELTAPVARGPGTVPPAARPARAGGRSRRSPPPSSVDLPETLRYRMKNALLGPPLVNEQLSGERLGRPSALGVLAPDCISSSAYGTEEMLNHLVPCGGPGRLRPGGAR